MSPCSPNFHYEDPHMLLGSLSESLSVYVPSQSCVNILDRKSSMFNVGLRLCVHLDPLLFVILVDTISHFSKGLDWPLRLWGAGPEKHHPDLQYTFRQFTAKYERNGTWISNSLSKRAASSRVWVYCGSEDYVFRIFTETQMLCSSLVVERGKVQNLAFTCGPEALKSVQQNNAEHMSGQNSASICQTDRGLEVIQNDLGIKLQLCTESGKTSRQTQQNLNLLHIRSP